MWANGAGFRREHAALQANGETEVFCDEDGSPQTGWAGTRKLVKVVRQTMIAVKYGNIWRRAFAGGC